MQPDQYIITSINERDGHYKDRYKLIGQEVTLTESSRQRDCERGVPPDVVGYYGGCFKLAKPFEGSTDIIFYAVQLEKQTDELRAQAAHHAMTGD